MCHHFLCLSHCCIHIPCLPLCPALQEEDATVWARYSSAQFDQGAGRHACNNPYNAKLELEIFENASKAAKMKCIFYKDFLDLIAPSFGGVEDAEDMAAILARTHLIVLTEQGVYWRLAGTSTDDVPFNAWPENQSKDLLIDAQKPIFKEYKKDPAAHSLPPNFHADSVWSQELLRKLLAGEEIPRTITIRGASLFGAGPVERHEVPRLLPHAEMQSRVKMPRSTVFPMEPVANPDSLPGMEVDMDMDDGFPVPGEADPLETALEEMMDGELNNEM